MMDSVKCMLVIHCSLGMIAPLLCRWPLGETLGLAAGWLVMGLLPVVGTRWQVPLAFLAVAVLAGNTWLTQIEPWTIPLFSREMQWWILPVSFISATLANRWHYSNRSADSPHV